MRWWLVLVLAGCESRYGAYINVDGDGNQIRFDHVQLYFGTKTSRTDIGKPSGPAMGTVFDRQFDPSDQFDVPPNSDSSKATESSFWLPPTPENEGIAYVAAVASNDQHPVGIGELLDFSIEDGVVFKYDIELQPYTLAEEWGTDPSCLAWARERDDGFSTIAVVHPDDEDCDGRIATADCNDLCPTGSTGCMNRGVCSGGANNTCGLGCAMGTDSCTPEVCTPMATCSALCAAAGIADKRLECMLDRTPDHLEITVDTMGAPGPLCQDQFAFAPYAALCKNPIIEWVDPRVLGDYKLTISESSGKCVVHLATATSAAFVGQHHILVSIDPPNGSGPRPTFILGVSPRAPMCSSTAELFTFQANGSLAVCQ